MNTRYRILFVLIITVLTAGFYYYCLYPRLSLAQLQESAHNLTDYVQKQYLLSVMIYMASLVTIVILGFSLVTLCALAAGYLFGVFWGFVFSLSALTIGCCAAVALYRYFFFDYLISRWGHKLTRLTNELHAHGGMYLLSLQLASGIPTFVINSLAAIAGVSLFTVFWTTAVGSVPFLFIYLLAGTKLLSISSVRDLFTPTMMVLLGLVALGALLPLIVRRISGRKK